MNWDAIGAISEGLGSFAVIVTLMYLAAQVRHARSELVVSVQNARVQGMRENWLNRSQNPELIDAIVKADQNLDEAVYVQQPYMRFLIEKPG